MSEPNLASNKKAFHDYEILETFEAGIVLLGSEVKSLRSHGGSIIDAYVILSSTGEPILKNASIAPYAQASLFNHEERRDRILLLHKREIAKLSKELQQKGRGTTIVVLALYLNKRGFVKAKIAIVRGKKDYDKRHAIKEKELNRSAASAMKRHM